MKNLILAVIILLAGVCTGEIEAKPQNKKAQIEQNKDSLKTKSKAKTKRARKAKAKSQELNDKQENAQKTQCTAITAKKKQCKRMTSSPSGKCWQHEKETENTDNK